MESKVTGSFARPDRSHYFAIAFAIVLISFSSAFATKLRCRDLATADADELLATVDRQSVKSGGGVQAGKYDCDPGGQSGCTWETTLEDDRMLDRDHRLIYVLSSHLTGSVLGRSVGLWMRVGTSEEIVSRAIRYSRDHDPFHNLRLGADSVATGPQRIHETSWTVAAAVASHRRTLT